MIASYAYIDAEVIQGNFLIGKGNKLPNAPLHSGSLWNEYTFQSGLREGLGIGGGLYAAGKR